MIHLNVQTKVLDGSSKLTGWQQFKLLLRLQKYARPYWDKILLRVISSQVIAFLTIVPTLLIPRLVDEAFPQRDFGLLLEIALLGLGAYGAIAILGLLSGAERAEILNIPGAGNFTPGNLLLVPYLPGNFMSAYTLPKIAMHLKLRFYEHVQRLSMRFFSQRPVGEHMFRSSADTDDSAYLASEVIPKVFNAIQRIAVLLLVLHSFGSWLLLLVAIYLVIFFVLRQWLVTGVRTWDRRYRVEGQRLDSVCREILFPWKLIKANGLERTAKRWYGSQACRMVRAIFARQIYFGYDLLSGQILLNTFLTFLTVFTGTRVLDGTMTLGEAFAVGAIAVQLITPFQDAISTFQLVRQRLVPAERMLETLAVEPDVTDPEHPHPLPSIRGHVELRNVSFSYNGGPLVLDNVSLVAEPGQKIAIVGPTGAGKTTLTNLLLRLYDPSQGQVLIDGVDYRSVRQEDLRLHMAVVPQTIITFTESIERNILYGKPTASREEVLRAGRLALVDEFALKLADGYATELSEGGSLSGGQKQRLCLARVLVRDPKVLILDEATSALDPVTEKQVVANIEEAFKDATRIVVAHNLLNARTADRIYVLDQGRIAESGSHEELMKTGALYKKLYAVEIASVV
jgi:ATP-binding cassette subfamily B protein